MPGPLLRWCYLTFSTCNAFCRITKAHALLDFAVL